MRIRTNQKTNSPRRGQGGWTLVEVAISATVGIIVLGALLSLMSVVAKEQRKEMVSSNLQQEANLLEDKITRLLRSMSITQSVISGGPISSGSPFYRTIIVARGPSPAAREALSYSPDNFTCTHTPNLASPNTRIVYSSPSSIATLRNLYFFISEKFDGAPDASAVCVNFQLDDNGTGTAGKTNSVTRSFTVTMRNN